MPPLAHGESILSATQMGMQAGYWFLLSIWVRDKQRSAGELVTCPCG